MKSLIIAEKPSLARNIIQAIEKNETFKKCAGYYESENYIVSWAVGHLLQLKDIADYEGEKQKWKDINLPYIPNKFEFKVKEDTKDQFKILKQLIYRDDVRDIINCGDPDREGEVIVRLILKEANNNKEVYRLWLPDQEENTILKALDKKELDSNYDNLYNEGIARTLLDWILGINETIYLTNKSGTLLRAGRILVPVVKKIYDRDMEIKNFQPVKYYQAESNEDNIKLTVDIKFSEIGEAEEKSEELNINKTIVEDITTKDVKKQPSKLFSLTSLQKYLNKKNKMSADKVLKITQKLYENKYTTYPRTDSEYMTEDEKEKAIGILKAFNDSNLEFKDKKTIFDSSKVEAHSAITPTTIIPKELSGDEKIVYETISNRFKANFCKEECLISETSIIIKNGENEFKLTGKSIKQRGFLLYENLSNNEKMLPNLNIGNEIKTKFVAVEKETQAPKKFTEADLLSYLEQPFRKENDEESEIDIKEIGLGTPATRAGIISNAKKMTYIMESKNMLSIGDLGIKLIETINKLEIDLYAEKTIEFSRDLKKVYEGKIGIQDCIKNAENEVRKVIINGANIKIEQFERTTKEKEIIGICPKCGKNIYEGEKSFYCEGYKDEPKCIFTIWKDNKYFKDRGRKLSKSIVKNLLKEEKVKIKGFKKKDGVTTYDAYISLDLSNDKYVNFSMSFN